MQLTALRPFVRRLNIFQPMVESITTQVDFILCHRIEHERVIRIGGMTQGKSFTALLCHLDFVTQTVFAFESHTKLWLQLNSRNSRKSWTNFAVAAFL